MSLFYYSLENKDEFDYAYIFPTSQWTVLVAVGRSRRERDEKSTSSSIESSERFGRSTREYTTYV